MDDKEQKDVADDDVDNKDQNTDKVDKQEPNADEAKQDYTSHWDRDYMPREQVDAAYEEGREKREEEEADESK